MQLVTRAPGSEVWPRLQISRGRLRWRGGAGWPCLGDLGGQRSSITDSGNSWAQGYRQLDDVQEEGESRGLGRARPE
jgi:hypothetical protein